MPKRVSGALLAGPWRGRGEFRSTALAPPPELKWTFHGISTLGGSGERVLQRTSERFWKS